MVTFAFFVVAVAHAVLIGLGTPFFLIGDLFIVLKGAFEGDRKSSSASEMNCGFHWVEVAKSWHKVWADD